MFSMIYRQCFFFGLWNFAKIRGGGGVEIS
jgi:hypothetical protein